MRILSQTNDVKGYHGTIGTPTNMYDYRGEQLFVGDVVCLATFGVDGKKAYDFGIEFVCEENTDIANWTGKNHQRGGMLLFLCRAKKRMAIESLVETL